MNAQTSLDAGWRRDFVMALRLRNSPPQTIADHLKLVETHCAESGESASDAFGEPAEYAQSLAGSPADSAKELAPLLPPAVLGFLAGGMTLAGVKGVIQDEAVTIRLGDVGAAAVLVCAALGVMVVLGRASRPLASAFAVVVSAVAVSVMLDVADTPVLAGGPAWLALTIGLAALGGIGVFASRASKRDRISDPLSGRPMI